MKRYSLLVVFLVVMLTARSGAATPCTDSPEGQMNCPGAFVSGDQNAANLGNMGLIIENLDADVTPLAQCTATESGVGGKACCVMQDLDKTALVRPAWTCGTTVYRIGSADIDVRQYGAVCDGNTDDTSAVSAAIAAATAGDTIRLCTPSLISGPLVVTAAVHLLVAPGGTLELGTTLVFRDLLGGSFGGTGREANVSWEGNATDPVILLDDVQRFELHDFRLSSGAVGGMNVGIALINGLLGTNSPRQRLMRNVVIDGTTAGATSRLLTRGMQWAAPQSSDCTASKVPWWCCTGADTGCTGICCTDATGASCNVSETCDRDYGVGGGGTECANTGSRDTCVLGIDANNDLDYIENVGVVNGHTNSYAFSIEHSQSVGHVFLNSRFAGAASDVIARGMNTAGPLTSGQMSWYGGSGGSATTDFYLGINSGLRSNIIDNWDSENSLALLDTQAGSSSSPVVVRGVRWVPGAGATGNMVRVQSRGPLTLEGNRLGKADMALTLNVNTASSAQSAHNAIGNYIASDAAAPFTVTHATLERWNLIGNTHNDNSVVGLLGVQQQAPTMMETTDPTKKASVTLTGLASGQTAIWTPIQEKCAIIPDLAATDDDFEIWQSKGAALITSVGCRCRGTCSTPATFTLENRSGTGMTITGTNPTCATTGVTTYAAVTANNSLTAGDGLAFDVTNGPTAGDEYTLCFTYLDQ